MCELSVMLNRLINEDGQERIAKAAGIDDSQLSKFRSGKGNLGVNALSNLFKILNLEVIPRDEIKAKEDALILITRLWDRERNK